MSGFLKKMFRRFTTDEAAQIRRDIYTLLYDSSAVNIVQADQIMRACGFSDADITKLYGSSVETMKARQRDSLEWVREWGASEGVMAKRAKTAKNGNMLYSHTRPSVRV